MQTRCGLRFERVRRDIAHLRRERLRRSPPRRERERRRLRWLLFAVRARVDVCRRSGLRVRGLRRPDAHMRRQLVRRPSHRRQRDRHRLRRRSVPALCRLQGVPHRRGLHVRNAPPGPLTCASTQCTDNLKNGLETDVDCGGGVCSLCAVAKACQQNFDCASYACDAKSLTCVASQCDDHRQDGNETAPDCGGSCPPCVVSKACLLDQDCASKACDATTLTCVADQCADHQKDGKETDVDCGGPCPPCALGQGCSLESDCISKHCNLVGGVPIRVLSIDAPTGSKTATKPASIAAADRAPAALSRRHARSRPTARRRRATPSCRFACPMGARITRWTAPRPTSIAAARTRVRAVPRANGVVARATARRG